MSNFVQERTPFIVMHGEVLFKREKDNRTCLEWARDMGYTKKQWEEAIRGYIMEDRVQFFTGDDYGCVVVVNDEIFNSVNTYHASIYGRMPAYYYNG